MTFNEFAIAQGLRIRDLSPADRIRRCPTEAHPRSKNGAYFYDGRKGWVMAWDGTAEVTWWSDGAQRPPSIAEQRNYRELRRQQRRELAARHAKSARTARERLKASVIGESPYLQYKRVTDRRAYLFGDVTLVPMRDMTTGALLGLQTIQWDPVGRTYTKKFWPGMRAKRAVLRIGRGLETVLCEGWATGLSIAEAALQVRLPVSVLCAFSASNLIDVARSCQGRAYVMADNDTAGIAAARATGLPWATSPVSGEDCNDLHNRAGVFALARLIQEVRKQ